MPDSENEQIVKCPVCERTYSAASEFCPYCGEGGGKKIGTVLEILLGLSFIWPMFLPSLREGIWPKITSICSSPFPAMLAGAGVLVLCIPPRFNRAGAPLFSVAKLLRQEIVKRVFFFLCAAYAVVVVSLPGGLYPGILSVGLLLAVRKYEFFPITFIATVFLFYLATCCL